LRPLARAVRTNSEASTASIEARVMRAIGASEKMPSVKAGRISLRERRPERLEIAGQQAVDQVEAGDVFRRRRERIEPADRRGRPAKAEIEQIDQEQAGEEYRQRYAGGRDNSAQMINPRTLLHGRENSERHRDDDRQDQAEQRELGGGRQAARYLGRHGRPVESELPKLPCARSLT